PIQSDFFDHFIMSSSFVHTHHRVIVDEEVQTDATEYVEPVKPCDKKEESRKVRRTILVHGQRCPEVFSTFRYSTAFMCTVNKVRPFPRLATKECKTPEDCPEHPFFNSCAIHTVTGLYSQYHCYRTHDENERHDTNEYERVSATVYERNRLKNLFRNWPVI